MNLLVRHTTLVSTHNKPRHGNKNARHWTRAKALLMRNSFFVTVWWTGLQRRILPGEKPCRPHSESKGNPQPDDMHTQPVLHIRTQEVSSCADAGSGVLHVLYFGYALQFTLGMHTMQLSTTEAKALHGAEAL
jgi:hypothetical protein